MLSSLDGVDTLGPYHFAGIGQTGMKIVGGQVVVLVPQSL